MPRILKFCTNIGYDNLYCVLKNQPHMAYQSLFCPFFFLSENFFNHFSSASTSARVFKFCIHDEDNQVYYCKKHGAEIYICLILFFPFSISHSKVMNIEIFVKNFLGTT